MTVAVALQVLGAWTALSVMTGGAFCAYRTIQDREEEVEMFHTIARKLWGSKKRKITTAITCLALAGAGTALAAWILTTNGTAGGAISSGTAPTMVAASTPASSCLPGGTCSASVTVTNSSGTAETLTGVSTFGNPAATESNSGSGCAATVITVPTQTGLSIPIPVGTSTIDIPNTFSLQSSAPSSCQNSTFTHAISGTFSVGS
jgi:hypothetical protein